PCREFCARRSRCAAPPFLIFLTRKDCREIISGIIVSTGERGRGVPGARRPSGASSWPGEAATFVPNASLHPADGKRSRGPNRKRREVRPRGRGRSEKIAI